MQSDVNNTICWIGLSSIPGVGRITFRKLLASFGSPGAVLAASRGELIDTGGVTARIADAIVSTSWRDAATEEVERARTCGVALVTFEDAGYPESLRSIPDPPLFLYIRGNLQAENRTAVAIVGTRTPTQYGRTVTYRMSFELASAGVTIVSGGARGIDTQAHSGALAAQGRTIAVLACGIDTAYPPENRGLLDRIAENGAVVTENPFGTRPESGYFPARNRIISGLAAGTVIVEATADSGSLITAGYALRQERMLFAVPGNAGSPTSRGTNSLIKQGAVLVENAPDVLARLGRKTTAPRVLPGALRPVLAPEEEEVLAAVAAEPRHIDAIGASCGSAPGKLSGILLALELKGLVKQLPGKYFLKDVE